MRESHVTNRSEDRCYRPGKRGDELPDELAHRESRLRKIQEARAALEADARAAAAAAGVEEKNEIEELQPAPKAQRNFTDPQSRIMLSIDKAFVQACNAQAAVDHGS